MSEKDEVLTKGQVFMLWLGKHWFWVALGILLALGCYYSATYLINLFRGGKKEK